VEGCPLAWWRAKRDFGNLGSVIPVVKKYFCIPATSVPSEQLFSMAGLLITKKRNALDPHNVDMILFLNKNI